MSNPKMKRRRILLYGDIDLNTIDGSAIWLLSMVEALSCTSSHVTVLLKKNAERNGFLDRIESLSNVSIVQPFAEHDHLSKTELSPRDAAQKLLEIDRTLHSDVVICRGSIVSGHVAGSPALAAKSWLYMTDIPHPAQQINARRLEQIRKIANSCRRMFAQTRDAQSYLESIAPEACGKTLVLTPMVPDEYFRVNFDSPCGEAIRLVYSGKFAKDWRTLEMCELPKLLSNEGIDNELTMIGDKFQRDPHDVEWASQMEASIQGDGLTWLGGMSRDAAVKVVSGHDISLSWRSQKMDDSFEISTKVLEAAALGVPPLINRNAAHEELFGVEYPLYVEKDDVKEVVDVLAELGHVPTTLREHVRECVGEYSISASARRLEAYFTASEPNYESVPRHVGKVRVVLASHDLKFAGELVDMLFVRDDIELRFDRWPSLHVHDKEASEALAEWADVVICEWAGPNAVWYSNNKRNRQKLIVRLHMFELRGPWLQKIAVEAIDTLICVSSLYEERVRKMEGWARANIKVIPNSVNSLDLNRPKLAHSEFRLGLVGIVPIRKRLDRAVELMQGLLERDERFTLHVKGRMPWEYDYEWKKPTQQMVYREIFSDIGADKRLLRSIVFEPFGADMGSWMRKIGFVLSPSSDESFHLAPAEGMASGAVPIFWDRPGVDGIFGDRWKVQDTSEAVNRIHALASNESQRSREAEAAVIFSQRFDVDSLESMWLAEVLELQK
ncbi:glycosyltransferase [Arthrobacter antibioticus]|uniref:glycosyltransferase n=1 Tax=Arthrobacter sp. H35-MC1 TaxID=3046203 RepID=UPI0024BB35F0|nr:glycosyltransferase [Arthrobacter sp. H35-MC1]MDJ0316237.1 glycosyltransferase [Arthrobacter sp. H35-MC1]